MNDSAEVYLAKRKGRMMIPQEIVDAAKHAQKSGDFRWLQAATRLFYLKARGQYAPHKEILEKRRAHNGRNSLIKKCLSLVGRNPPHNLPDYEKAERLCNQAIFLKEAAEAENLCPFLPHH